jgi:hypothetical protein
MAYTLEKPGTMGTSSRETSRAESASISSRWASVSRRTSAFQVSFRHQGRGDVAHMVEQNLIRASG